MKSTKIMVVGGCFDILHLGHLDFLKKAREKCDYLIVLLEPDEKVRMMKGAERPKTNLESRILNLEKTGLVDEVVPLPVLKTDREYELEIKKIMVKWLNGSVAKKNSNLDPGSHILNNNKVVRDDKKESICVNPLSICVNPTFALGITKNDRNEIKNQKIRALGKKLGIEVNEVNELLPEWSTSRIVNCNL